MVEKWDVLFVIQLWNGVYLQKI